ncbi:hypothetical protein [Sinorhizobium fredii]|uniref:hypothetical protein n=1 Tax=Rhizobium fredii TaxID=380 RepID=UPI001FCA4D40|nr:hypothetical protein [Sinorhizobium fredii]
MSSLAAERRLEQIAVQTHHVVETPKDNRRLRADEPSVTDQPSHDRAVLLLDPSLIVLSIRSRTGHLQSLTSAPADHTFVHEGAIVVEVHALQREWKQRAGLIEGSDNETAFARADWHALGPARSDIGQHHRLNETTGRRVRSYTMLQY